MAVVDAADGVAGPAAVAGVLQAQERVLGNSGVVLEEKEVAVGGGGGPVVEGGDHVAMIGGELLAGPQFAQSVAAGGEGGCGEMRGECGVAAVAVPPEAEPVARVEQREQRVEPRPSGVPAPAEQRHDVNGRERAGLGLGDGGGGARRGDEVGHVAAPRRERDMDKFTDKLPVPIERICLDCRNRDRIRESGGVLGALFEFCHVCRRR